MKRCTLVFAMPAKQWSWHLELQEDATVADALAEARRRSPDAQVPWDAEVGIFGEICGRDFQPRDGDRIEIYRSLKLDPKESRRARAAARRAAGDPASARLPRSDPKPR